ncbi:MAG: cytochrome b N-terminal domain-containing protein [Opitutales bacterium]|nr:cytochrome b N-terminal domain-containing protein [Opitutales bacterium]
MYRLRIRFGHLALSALLISCLSGIALAYHYDWRTPYDSIAAIDMVLPLGSIIRSLHWYSSQCFVVFVLLHLLEYVFNGSFRSIPLIRWIPLIWSVVPIILLMFSGYLLKGDAVGASAGSIAEHLALSLPGVGNTINRLLFAMECEGLSRVYVNHVIVFGIVAVWMLWRHLRNRTFDKQILLIVFSGCLIISLIWRSPMDSRPVNSETILVKGPWFFLGLQELLRHLPALWAGIIFPTILLAFVSILPVAKGRWQIVCYCVIILWIILYGILSVVAWFR